MLAPTETNGKAVLSVVIPAYNEETSIAQILERVFSVRGQLAAIGVGNLEVIVVDDGSRDRTVEVVQRYPDVRLVQHDVNRGYGAALKTGFYQAGGSLLAFLDADGTYPPEHFPELCEAALSGADLVIGSRMAGADSQMPAVRRLGNFLFASLVSLLGDHRVSDSASGMRVIRREVLNRLYPLPDGLNFTPVMSLRAMHEGLKMVEVPIPYSERVGRSKLSVIRDGLRFTNSIVWTALSYNPVRILGLLGLGGVAVALFVGLWLVATRLRGVTTLGKVEVGLLFLGVVCGVAGISLFNLGATFNYLVSLFRKQPVRAGLFGKPIFDPPLDRHFGWLGGATMLGGFALGALSFTLSLHGWEMARLWLYLVGSTSLVLVGLQLMISWVLMRTLEELSNREARAERDLNGRAACQV